MPKYREKNGKREVEAVRATERTAIRGGMVAEEGDYIVTCADGVRHPVKPELFEAIAELAPEEA